MKKIIISTLLLLALLGCVSTPQKKVVQKPKVVEVFEILDEKFYIDIDDTTVKFLFKAKKGDLVNFFIGESKDSLVEVKSGVAAGLRGIKVDGLKPGTTYFYQIESVRGTQSIKSDVLSFTKIDRTNNWSRAEWAKTAIFYEVFVRSFNDSNGDGIGDFKGLENKIPYLKELGVNALWLMPVLDSPSYHGYDVKNYYEVEPDYGTKEDFTSLLKSAHENGIKIIMDLVVNHSSTENPWFQDAAKSVDSPYRDYYDWADSTDRLTANGPFGGKMWHKKNGYNYNAIFWSGMPDLNLRNVTVRTEIKNIAAYWLDPNNDGDFTDGVDGYRLDAALHIDSKDKEVSHNWWQEFNTYVKDVNPEAFLVGENWTSTNSMAAFFADLDSSFNFSFASNMLDMARGRKVDLLSNLNGIHRAYSKHNNNYIDSTFLTNHDQTRVGSELNGDITKINFAASILLTLPGTPFIYYGEELGMLGRKPDDNLREPFDWYTSATGEGMTSMEVGGFYNPSKYTKADDGISYQEESGVEGSTLEFYKKLIAIRKEFPQMSFDKNYEKVDLIDGAYSYNINCGTKNLLIVHNYSKEDKSLNISEDGIELLSNKELLLGDNLTIPALTTVIVQTEI